jgi:hypothetical protein
MKDEIYAGIKNAINRGSTVEAAVQSLINAGYNPPEVKEAARLIESGASQFVVDAAGGQPEMVNAQPEKKQEVKKDDSAMQLPTAPEQTVRPTTQAYKSESSGTKVLMIVAIILAGLCLIGGIGLLVYYYFIR